MSQRTTGGYTAAAMAVMNVATYAYQMVAANILGPRPYGAFLALVNVFMIVSVVALGLQATGARRISAHPDNVAEIERDVLRSGYRLSIVLGIVLLFLSPVLDRLLGLNSLVSAALVGISVVPMTIFGAQAGVLQGERRWRALGVLYVLAGVPRLVIGTALILGDATTLMAMLGVAVGCFAPVVAGAALLRRPRTLSGDEEPESSAANVADPEGAEPTGSVLSEIMRSSQGLLAFFALANIDIVVARNVLTEHDAGLYAAGLIVVKAVLFLPQFVVVIAFPAMSTVSERRRALTRSLSVVALLGAVCVSGTWLLDDLAMLFAGGNKFREVQQSLWLFAIVGTFMSTVQLLVYSVLARQSRANLLVWAGVIALIVAGLTTSTIAGLLSVVLIVDACVLGALLAATYVALREYQPAQRHSETG